jgi:hypothetical protein
MTTKDAFTPEEWAVLKRTLHEPAVAVMLAARGGMIQELMAVLKAISDAEEKFADSELIQALLHGWESKAAAEPTSGDFMDGMIANLRQASKLVQAKATAQEVHDYQDFILFMTEKVAKAAKEGSLFGAGGQEVTEDEQRVLDEIKLALKRKV